MASKHLQIISTSLLLLAFGSASAVKIGVSYDLGGKHDGGFNASAFSGLKRAQSRVGAQIMEVVPDEKTHTYKLDTLAQQGADLIIGVGFSQQEAIRKAAATYPNQQFALIDSVVEGKNITSVTFREEEGSYLVGYLAALNSSTGMVGFMGGMDVPLIHKFQAGFTAGVKAADPKVKVVVQYVGNAPDAWNNPSKAKGIAASMRAKGVDVIYAAAGGSGLGVVDYIKQTQCLKASQLPKGMKFTSDNFAKVPKSASYQAACKGDTRPMFFIGVDSNQNYLGDFDKNPATLNHGLTSMLKRVDNAVYTLSLWATRKTSYPTELSLGLRENGVSFAVDQYNKDLLKGELLGQLESIKQMVISGNIKVPKE